MCFKIRSVILKSVLLCMWPWVCTCETALSSQVPSSCFSGQGRPVVQTHRVGTSKPKESSSPCLPNAGVTNACHHIFLFCLASGIELRFLYLRGQHGKTVLVLEAWKYLHLCASDSFVFLSPTPPPPRPPYCLLWFDNQVSTGFIKSLVIFLPFIFCGLLGEHWVYIL